MAKRASLKTYRQKRHFDVTPEPPPRPAEGPTGDGTFMVHKHDASRLHYDVRLGMDGVLASWAVPKGPSYDPAQKRLAVQTEDHPMEYGGFEGRIPDGEYGAGDSIIWDRGTYDTVPPGQASAQRRKGHLHLRLDGEKLKGEWHLVRTRQAGGKQQWLLFKAADGTEAPGYDVVAERPESVASGRRVTRGPLRQKVVKAFHPRPEALLKRLWPPMKATLSKPSEASAATHLFEVKYDGYRALAGLSGGKVALWSRNQLDFGARYPALVRALGGLKVAEAVLDGEIVALDRHGVSHFQDLQGSAPARLVLFDLLWLDGEDLRSRPLEERRELLASVLSNVEGGCLALSEEVALPTDEALALARRRGLEGVMAKRRGSPYVNARSDEWLKLKVVANQEVAIVGYTCIRNGAPEIGALLVAVHEEGGYRYVGKVGTGYDRPTRRRLRRLLAKDRLEEPPVADAPRVKGAVWVKPRYVAEVSFAEWTRDGKLRQPAFQGLREDKGPQEVVMELPRAGRREAPRKRAARQARAPAVDITHPERLVYPEAKVTKAQVVGYYREVAPFLLPALADRPLSFQQWPRGIEAPGFYRQSAGKAPPFVRRAEVSHNDHVVEHILVENEETLAWLANQSALTLHMASSRVQSVDAPDWVAFDLDPAATDWNALVPVAQALRGLLEELELVSVPKTTGKRGLHVLVPLARGYTHAQALAFAEAVAGVLAQRFPKLATTDRPLNARHGRLYIDAQQNGRLKTLVAPYSLRAVPAASASTPLHWDEVSTALDPAQWNLRTLPERLARVGDLFAPALKTRQNLPVLK